MQNTRTQVKGAYIVLHDPRQTPSFQKDAMLLQPRTLTNIAVDTTHLSRLPAPYQSQCISDYPDYIKSMIGQSAGGMLYSMQVCTNFCYRDSFYQACGCYTFESFEGDVLASFSQQPLCNSSNWEVGYCIQNHTFSLDFDNMCSECKPECDRIKYKVSF